MDWSKAKNILIAALIAANLFIGAKYWQVRTAGEEARVRSAFLTGEYLQSLGVDLQCELSADETRLPVLFVEIEPEDASTQDPVTRDGTRVVLIGSSGQRAVPKSFGDNKGLVVSASSAASRHFCFQTATAFATSSRKIQSASCTIRIFSGVTSPTIRMPRPGPGNGWRLTRYSGMPSSLPT